LWSQETESLFADYTNTAALTSRLVADAEEAGRVHRRHGGGADLFNQAEWFRVKLRQLADETREVVLPEDDDNHALQETVDDGLKSALQAFGSYLAQKYLASQIAIVKNELSDAADMAALVLPDASVHQIADAPIETLGSKEEFANVGCMRGLCHSVYRTGPPPPTLPTRKTTRRA